MSTFNIPILQFFAHLKKKQLNLAAGENNSTRPINSKTKTIAGEKQLNSGRKKNSPQHNLLRLHTISGEKQLNSTGGGKQLNSATGEKSQLCAACDRRIGFYYLLLR
ncbi:hypothetical protein TNCV_4547731 [Trichonephila clavipes]|nr:hypothetical protein TNCV_4547731 [Trichonephila clavipes]